MLLTRVRLDNYIIHVDFDIYANEALENFVHESLVRGTSVSQAKRHQLVVKINVFYHECHILLVSKVHTNLVITRISVA